MKKSVVIFITAVCLLITGCGDTGSLSKLPASSFHEDKQKLTIMHIDADNKRFQDFIEETEKKLDMEITVEKCPSNADNRQAKISTILASGDKNIDLISVNDEMNSEFKHKGYLEPLEKNVMTEEVRDSFPQKYLESICEENGHIYSVPFQLDIMMIWVGWNVKFFINSKGVTAVYDASHPTITVTPLFHPVLLTFTRTIWTSKYKNHRFSILHILYLHLHIQYMLLYSLYHIPL